MGPKISTFRRSQSNFDCQKCAKDGKIWKGTKMNGIGTWQRLIGKVVLFTRVGNLVLFTPCKLLE